MAVDLNGQSTLVGEKIGKSQDLDVSPLHRVSPIFRGTLVERRVPRLFLHELNRVEGRAVCLFQKEQVATLVHDADGYFNVERPSLRFSRGDHRLDSGQIQVFPDWQVGRRSCCRETQHHNE